MCVGGSWGRHCGDVCATGLWVAPLPVHRDGEGPPGPLRLVWPCVNASGRRQAWAARSHLSYPTAPGAPNLSVATHVRPLPRPQRWPATETAGLGGRGGTVHWAGLGRDSWGCSWGGLASQGPRTLEL